MEYGGELHKESYILPLAAMLKPSSIVKEPDLVSRELRLSGKPDYIFVSKFDEYIPVEVKWAEERPRGVAKRDHKLQMAAYALLVEDRYGTVVKRGYIYYVRSGKIVKVHVDSSLKLEVKKVIKRIYDIIRGEEEPRVKVGKSKCKNCGWRGYCRGGLEWA